MTRHLARLSMPLLLSAWVERGTLSPASRYELRGGILVEGRATWVSADWRPYLAGNARWDHCPGQTARSLVEATP